MKKLFDLLDRILSGQIDLRHEKILAASAEIESALIDAHDELFSHGQAFGDFLVNGLNDIGNDYTDGTAVTITEYKLRIEALYRRAEKLLEDEADASPF